jgi:putative transposase
VSHWLTSPSHSVGSVVRGLKAASTARVHKLAEMKEMRLWQRNYYEHVIRSERTLERIREYILGNPLRWNEDRFYRDDGGFLSTQS